MTGMILFTGFTAEKLVLDGWPWWVHGLIALAFLITLIITESHNERRRWVDAHAAVFQFLRESYTSRAAWIFTAYMTVVVLTVFAALSALAEWLAR